jgi:hypothetical protein
MDSAGFPVSPLPPRHSPLPDELNYLLSLLTPRRLLVPDGSISSIPLLVSCSDPSLYSFCATTAVSFVSPSPASRPALTGARSLFIVTLSFLMTFVSYRD